MSKTTEWNLKHERSQFHYGSIKTIIKTNSGYEVINGLNSTMVRLKQNFEDLYYEYFEEVSIPLWFD